MSHTRLLLAALLAMLTLAACSSAGPTTPAGSTPPVDPNAPRVEARDLIFTTPTVTVPADEPFALVFDNQEALPHNVEIKAQDGSSLFTGEVFSGPAVRTYQVRALGAGTYTFICTVHPNMVGELTAS